MIRRQIDAQLCRVAAAVVLLVGCASPPGAGKKTASDSCRCKVARHDVSELLSRALSDPTTAESAHALAHLVERLHKRDPAAGNLLTDAQGNRYALMYDIERRYYARSDFDELGPASAIKSRKLERHQRVGVGAPLAALRENWPDNPLDAFQPVAAITRPVTAIIRTGELEDDGVRGLYIDLLNPMLADTVELQGKEYPLAADFTVPWMLLVDRMGNVARAELRDFAQATKRREPRLYLLEAYDPNKEPLIMIHGLLGTPLIWVQLCNTLHADEAIRSRYQIWHFVYNTSAPALYSGRVLRNHLREVRAILDPDGDDPAMQSTTVIAHSMGGIISRTLLTKPENAFWDAAFKRPFDSLVLSDEDRASLKEAFFWDSTSHVKRVIYIAASHRGSDVADSFVGRLGRFAANPPSEGFREFYQRISAANPDVFTEQYKPLGEGKLDSIHALSPREPTLPILASLPNNHPVREFSIIGNEGKSGPIEQSSDGTVPYWSSHIDRAESEKIVPAGHYAIDHPETVAEVKRILILP